MKMETVINFFLRSWDGKKLFDLDDKSDIFQNYYDYSYYTRDATVLSRFLFI